MSSVLPEGVEPVENVEFIKQLFGDFWRVIGEGATTSHDIMNGGAPSTADLVYSLLDFISMLSFPVCLNLGLFFILAYVIGFNSGKRNCLMSVLVYTFIRGFCG